MTPCRPGNVGFLGTPRRGKACTSPAPERLTLRTTTTPPCTTRRHRVPSRSDCALGPSDPNHYRDVDLAAPGPITRHNSPEDPRADAQNRIHVFPSDLSSHPTRDAPAPVVQVAPSRTRSGLPTETVVWEGGRSGRRVSEGPSSTQSKSRSRVSGTFRARQCFVVNAFPN